MGAFIGDQLWLVKNFINLFLNNHISFNAPLINETYLLPVFFPMASIILTFGLNLSYKLITEQKNKKFLKDTFGKYVSPKLIDEMYANKELPALGGESGVRTAFFSDLQSFSTISEQLSSQELVELLNEFLSSQTEIIINQKGTLDKYEGDAILAFFGAPMFFDNHPRAAVDSSVHCKNNLVTLSEKWKSEGKKWPKIVHSMKMRVGVNSGEMVTGNMGSKHHMNYTMMGDVVNTAARLESAAKQYGICIFTTEDTLQLAGIDRYCWRYIDRVQFVGKTVWYQTVEIIGFKKDADADTTKLIDLFHNGLEKYYNQEWDEAINIFNKSLKLETYDVSNYTNPSQVFIDRAQEFKKFPPRTGWRGAFVLTSK
jgi:adenylate cyclase